MLWELFQREKEVVASVYLDILKPVSQKFVLDLLQFIEVKQLSCIIAVDSNAHSTLYGPEQNGRGDQFEDLVASFGLSIANNCHSPTFRTTRASSCIDVTLFKGGDLELLDWRVDLEYNGSDHSTILFDFITATKSTEMVRPWGRADWGKFSELLEKDSFYVPESLDQRKVDRMIGKLYNRIEVALYIACP